MLLQGAPCLSSSEGAKHRSRRTGASPRERTVNIGSLDLDCGVTLPDVDQHVAIYGEPRDDGSNVVFVPHALTGSARVADWWAALLAPGAPFDLARWCVVGVNALGSCYGSTGPTSLARDGTPYGSRFPRVSVRDIVSAQHRALSALGIARCAVVIGASLGGMQALQWALDFPECVDRAIVVGAHDHQTPMAVAFNSIQRDAIALEPRGGLRIARKLAMLTYKSEALLRTRHDRRADRHDRPIFDVEGYLEHQADLFEARMEPYAYVALTHAMDSQDVRADHRATDDERRRHPERSRRAGDHPSLLFVGISSDWLFRPEDVRAAVARFSERGYDVTYEELVSDHGHDAFLADPQALAEILTTRSNPAR